MPRCMCELLSIIIILTEVNNLVCPHSPSMKHCFSVYVNIFKSIAVQLTSQCLLKTQTKSTVPRIRCFRPKPQCDVSLHIVLNVRVITTQSALVWKIAWLNLEIVFWASFRVNCIKIRYGDFEVMPWPALQWPQAVLAMLVTRESSGVYCTRGLGQREVASCACMCEQRGSVLEVCLRTLCGWTVHRMYYDSSVGSYSDVKYVFMPNIKSYSYQKSFCLLWQDIWSALSSYPLRQWQEKDPLELAHLCSHPPLFPLHSFISAAHYMDIKIQCGI